MWKIGQRVTTVKCVGTTVTISLNYRGKTCCYLFFPDKLINKFQAHLWFYILLGSQLPLCELGLWPKISKARFKLTGSLLHKIIATYPNGILNFKTQYINTNLKAKMIQWHIPRHWHIWITGFVSPTNTLCRDVEGISWDETFNGLV